MFHFLFKLISFVVLLPFRILFFPFKYMYRSLCRRLSRMPFIGMFLSGLIVMLSSFLIKSMATKKRAPAPSPIEIDEESSDEDDCCPADEDEAADDETTDQDDEECEENEADGPEEMEMEYTLKQYGLFNFLIFSGEKPKRPGPAKA